MRFALPATRTFVYLCGGVVASIVTMLFVGGAVEAVVGPEVSPLVGIVFGSVFFALIVLMMCLIWALMMCLIWALMIRSVIGFQATVWTRIAAARRSRNIADNVARIAPSARKIGDVIILAGWLFWAFGLSIMLPVMIRDGFFS